MEITVNDSHAWIAKALGGSAMSGKENNNTQCVSGDSVDVSQVSKLGWMQALSVGQSQPNKASLPLVSQNYASQYAEKVATQARLQKNLLASLCDMISKINGDTSLFLKALEDTAQKTEEREVTHTDFTSHSMGQSMGQ